MDDAVRRLCRPGTAAGLDRLGPQELQVSVQLRPLGCYVEVATKSHQPIRHRVVRIGGGPRLTERSGCDGHRRERLHQNGADHSMPARADDGTSLGNLHAVLRQLRGHVRCLFGGAGPRQLPSRGCVRARMSPAIPTFMEGLILLQEKVAREQRPLSWVARSQINIPKCRGAFH